MGDLIADAKANPGKRNYGSWSVGNPVHLGSALFDTVTGVEMQHVIYKETTQLYTGVANGELDYALGTSATSGALYRAGKLKYLAIAGPKRLPAFKDVPTVAEAGGPAGFEVSGWTAIAAPKGLPKAVADKIQRDIEKALAEPDVREKFVSFGYESFTPTREQFNQYIASNPRASPASSRRPASRSTDPKANMQFTKTPGWLDWYAGPSKPQFKLPAGSVDAHCHVFGPGEQFPFAPERKYTPCDASKDQLFALRDHLGFDKNVIVQATCHGADNSALLDALKHSNGKARGVVTVKRSITDRELEEMNAAGVRGVRFNFVKRLVDFTPKDELIGDRRAHRAAGLACGDLFRGRGPARAVDCRPCPPRWWLTIWAAQRQPPGRWARVRTVREIHARVSRRLVQGQLPQRLEHLGPRALHGERNAYRDVVPFARRIVETFPGPGTLGHRLAASEPEGPHAR